MNLSRNIALFTLGLLAVAWGGWFLIGITKISVPYYPIIPIVFYALGIVSIIAVSKCKKEEGVKTAKTYMILKMTKFTIVMAAALLAFVLMSKTDARIFIIAFAVYYALFIVFETLFIYYTEKQQKNAT